MLVTACCTDTASMVHQRLAHADEAARRTAGGARWAVVAPPAVEEKWTLLATTPSLAHALV